MFARFKRFLSPLTKGHIHRNHVGELRMIWLRRILSCRRNDVAPLGRKPVNGGAVSMGGAEAVAAYPSPAFQLVLFWPEQLHESSTMKRDRRWIPRP